MRGGQVACRANFQEGSNARALQRDAWRGGAAAPRAPLGVRTAPYKRPRTLWDDMTRIAPAVAAHMQRHIAASGHRSGDDAGGAGDVTRARFVALLNTIATVTLARKFWPLLLPAERVTACCLTAVGPAFFWLWGAVAPDHYCRRRQEIVAAARLVMFALTWWVLGRCCCCGVGAPVRRAAHWCARPSPTSGPATGTFQAAP